MQKKSADVRHRNFLSTPGLSDEARQAVNDAFDAMSAWRTETAKTSEKSSEQVIEKMAAAARALGWPEEIVETTRAQMQTLTKMQIQTMDQIMDAWEEQIKSASPLTNAAAMLSKLRSLPSSAPASSLSDAGAMNPFQFWVQFAEQWQKASADAMAFWAKGGRPADKAG
jgi:uncharacterized protein YPO0396